MKNTKFDFDLIFGFAIIACFATIAGVVYYKIWAAPDAADNKILTTAFVTIGLLIVIGYIQRKIIEEEKKQ